MLAACAQPADAPGSPVDGLHACPAAGSLIGVFTGQDPTSGQDDSPAVEGSDTWGLTVGGTAQQVTRDGVHTGAVISPDGLTIYQLRSSGRQGGDSMEAASVVEQRDVRTGRTTTVTQLPGIVDLAVSDDGRRLAVAHTAELHPDTGLDVNTVAVVDLASPGTPIELSRAPDVAPDLYSAVPQVALSPDGAKVAYALAVEVRRGTVVTTLRIRDLGTNADNVAYTAQSSDFFTDLAWSPDGATVLAAIRYQNPGDDVDSPARFRTLRVDLAGGGAAVEPGYAPDLSPRSVDAGTLIGLGPAPGNPRDRALVSWARGRGPSDRLPIGHGAAGISVASCSYR